MKDGGPVYQAIIRAGLRGHLKTIAVDINLLFTERHVAFLLLLIFRYFTVKSAPNSSKDLNNIELVSS